MSIVEQSEGVEVVFERKFGGVVYSMVEAPREKPLTIVYAKDQIYLLFTPLNDRSIWSVYGYIGINTVYNLGVAPFRQHARNLRPNDLDKARRFGKVEEADSPSRFNVDLELGSNHLYGFIGRVWMPHCECPKIRLGDFTDKRILPAKLSEGSSYHKEFSTLYPTFGEL